MPFKNVEQLPPSLQRILPSHAQHVYMEAFNGAWETYADRDKERGYGSHEEVSHRVAWAAVKRKYHKNGNKWKPKEEASYAKA